VTEEKKSKDKPLPSTSGTIKETVRMEKKSEKKKN